MTISSGHLHHHLQAVVYLGAVRDRTDRELLELFLNQSAPVASAAFDQILERHGPLVLRLCEQVLGNRHDAEDAAQATFLILARQAVAIRDRDALAGWLHGVALRTARRARARSVRQRRLEQQSAEQSVIERRDPGLESTVAVLHEELARLPETHRTPLVLCALEGLSNEQAAAQLRLPVRTLQRRLAEARSRLRSRLERRGVAPALLLTAGSPGLGLSPVPLPLAWQRATVRAALEVAAGLTTRDLLWASLSSWLGRLLGEVTLFRLAIAMLVPLATGVGLYALYSRPGGPASAASPVVAPARAVTHSSQVGAALGDGVRFLRSAQNADGSWPESDPRIPGGMTSLAVLALLAAGEPADAPHVARGLERVASMDPLKIGKTYGVALQAMVLARADAVRYRRLIVADVLWLERAQIREGDRVPWPGSWTYESDQLSQGDNSNTHFALLGLHAAREAGIPVDPAVFERAGSYWRKSQRQDGADAGTWGYYPNDRQRPSASMACAGLTSLLICDAARRAATDPPRAPDPEIRRALDWLGAHFHVDQNLGRGAGWKFYYLAALGRVGQLSGLRRIGDHDWYDEGSRYLLEIRDPATGSWKGDVTAESKPTLATCFALLFLSQGRPPG